MTKHYPVMAWWPGKRTGPPAVLGFDANLSNQRLTVAYCMQTTPMRRGAKRVVLTNGEETITALVEWETTSPAAYKLDLRVVSD